MAESVQTIFCRFTPCAEIVVHLKRYPDWFRTCGRVGVRNLAFPTDFTSSSNTAYCDTMHMCDTDVSDANSKQLSSVYMLQ